MLARRWLARPPLLYTAATSSLQRATLERGFRRRGLDTAATTPSATGAAVVGVRGRRRCVRHAAERARGNTLVREPSRAGSRTRIDRRMDPRDVGARAGLARVSSVAAPRAATGHALGRAGPRRRLLRWLLVVHRERDVRPLDSSLARGHHRRMGRLGYRARVRRDPGRAVCRRRPYARSPAGAYRRAVTRCIERPSRSISPP
jgi:hypothetical protein